MSVVDPQQLRARFDAPAPLTIGVEEEVMLLDPRTLDLAPRAHELLGALRADPRFTRELPAAQLEIVLPPVATAGEAVALLGAARRDLLAAAGGDLAIAAAGVHPFTAPLGALSAGPRYERIAAAYGDVARAQLVFALQVHVCVRGADRALAVYNALRGELPLVAALAANAPVHAGRDTGLASVRPHISGLLPRQGVPPALASWEAYAAALGRLEDPAQWWWEVRPHLLHGTLEVRVPDAQPSLAEAGAVIAVVHALVAWLAARHDAGEPLPVPERWAIEEDRWLAARHGPAGPLRDRVHALLDALEPFADGLGCATELAVARTMAGAPGAERVRAAFAARGARATVAAMADAFTATDARSSG
jgi:glutamate---cysteine ligase / carboxylate-amine ligase